jgi:hypothetical protein
MGGRFVGLTVPGCAFEAGSGGVRVACGRAGGVCVPVVRLVAGVCSVAAAGIGVGGA